MVRYMRISDRWGPVAPVRRVEPFRQDDPAEREWVRMLFESPRPVRKATAYSSRLPDAAIAPLYDEAGKLRDQQVLEVGHRMDLTT